MCHICRKVQALGGLDYKATKAIFLAVAKLHKNVEPNLGDLWLLRHDRTAKLRKMLSNLHQVVPASALEGIIAVVDKEMEHIKRQMSEHPPSHSTGRWEDLKGSITPSESASGQMRKRLEGKKESGNDEEKSTKTIPRPNKNEMTPPSPPELSGSDSDPPAVIMQQSAILVEAWLRECDLTMAHGDSRETDSMVSLLGGGIVTRPKVDVPIWRRLSIKSIAKPTFSRSRNTTKVANTPDFVYEKPSQKAQLESDILEELNENREKASKGQIMSRLRNLLNRRKEQKTDESNADIDELIRARHPLQEDYEDWELFMAGGRSSGVRGASIQAIASNSTRSPSTIERSSQGEATTSLSDADNNLRQIGFDSRKHNPLDSTISAMSSNLSSRSSNLNIGSLIEQAISPFELRDRERRETQREKPLDTFVPTAHAEPLLEQPHRSSTTPRQLRRKPSFEFFRPSTPNSIKQTYDSPPQWTHSLRRVPAMTVLQPAGGSVKERMQIGDEKQGVSMVTASWERRQADRVSDGTGEFGRLEGQSAKVYAGVSEFTKNRERRRAERQSASPILRKKGAGEAKTLGGEEKGARGTRGFDIEDEEVASGAAWGRRMKKAQGNSKKPVSENYRAEERQKYWTSPK